MNSIEIITKADLNEFKSELLEELKSWMMTASTRDEVLRTKEALKLLKISPGTLQTMKLNGLIPFKKIQGVVYFKKNDLLNLIK